MTLAGPIGAALVAAVAASAPASPAVTTVSLDLTALDEASYRRVGALSLEKQAVLRLVQESFAVVAPSAEPDVRLSVEATEAGLRLVAVSRAGRQSREIALGSEPQQELHLEVSQKLVELARAVAPPPAPSPIEPAPAPAPPPAAPRPWWSVDVAAGGGMVFRKGGNDPEVRLSLRWGGKLGVKVGGAYQPSSSTDLRVLEWALLAGPTWRQPLHERVWLEVGLQGGVLLHHFTLWNEYSADEAGDRRDFLASVPVELTWNPGSVLTVSLRVAGRVAGRSREHLFNDRLLWRRGAWGLEAGGTLGARF